MVNKYAVVIIIGIVLGAVFTTGMYLGVSYPAETKYNQRFGTFVLLAEQNPSLNTSAHAMEILYKNMNETFPHDQYNYAETYGAAPLIILGYSFNADMKYENTLAATETQFKGTLQNFETAQRTVNQNYAGGVSTEQVLLQQIRADMQLTGNVNIDWALKPAFMLQFYPMEYWAAWYYGLIRIVALAFIAVGFYVCFKIDCRKYRQERSRYNSRYSTYG